MIDKLSPPPLISIVVPVYNVEKYITQCVESIRNQHYSNIEIIIINDGSPDNSGAIAEQLAAKDPRIKVIHTENKGVSSARNLGIDVSKGQYIAFVDSDDYLAPDFIDYMLLIVRETQATFVMSKNCFTAPDEAQVEKDVIETRSPSLAAADLLYPYIEIGCWNKLFNRDFLIQNAIKFPLSFHMGEGLNFIVTAAQLSNAVGVGSRKVYYYRKDNMQSATTAFSTGKFINALAAIENIEKNSNLNDVDFKVALSFHKYLTTFYGLNAMIRTKTETIYKSEYMSWAQTVRNDAWLMMKAKVRMGLKLRIMAYSFFPTQLLKLRFELACLKRKFLG